MVQSLEPYFEQYRTAKIGTDVCEKARDSDFCFFYTAVKFQAPEYCAFVEDSVGCKLSSYKLQCFTYDVFSDVDEHGKEIESDITDCVDSQLLLVETYNVSLAKEYCESNIKRGSMSYKKVCDSWEWDEEDSNLTESERFMLLKFLSGLMGYEEETVYE